MCYTLSAASYRPNRCCECRMRNQTHTKSQLKTAYNFAITCGSGRNWRVHYGPSKAEDM